MESKRTIFCECHIVRHSVGNGLTAHAQLLHLINLKFSLWRRSSGSTRTDAIRFHDDAAFGEKCRLVSQINPNGLCPGVCSWVDSLEHTRDDRGALFHDLLIKLLGKNCRCMSCDKKGDTNGQCCAHASHNDFVTNQYRENVTDKTETIGQQSPYTDCFFSRVQ